MRKTSFYPIVAAMAILLPSCQIKTDKTSPFLEENVMWSTDDGAISFSVQGNNLHEGFGEIAILGSKVEALFSFYVRTNRLNIQDEGATNGLDSGQYLSFGLKGVGDALEITWSNNSTVDPMYDSYSSTLRKRPLEDGEIDARLFGRFYVFEDENASMSLWHTGPSFFTGRLDGLVGGKAASFSFLPDRRFSLDVDGGLYGAGSYNSYRNGEMGLVFKEGAGLLDHPDEFVLKSVYHNFAKYGPGTGNF